MKVNYVQLGDGEKRPVCFSLSAIEELEEEFGSLDAMRQGLVEGSVKAINRVLEIMLRAGNTYCAAMGMDCPPPLKCRPSDLLDSGDTAIVHDIFAVIRNDTERGVETKGKN